MSGDSGQGAVGEIAGGYGCRHERKRERKLRRRLRRFDAESGETAKTRLGRFRQIPVQDLCCRQLLFKSIRQNTEIGRSPLHGDRR